MTKEQMEIINKLVWFIPFRKKRDAIRIFLILLVDRFNNIDNRFNVAINQNEDLLTYMKNVNNVTVNYLFSLKKELVELKGNIGGKNRFGAFHHNKNKIISVEELGRNGIYLFNYK